MPTWETNCDVRVSPLELMVALCWLALTAYVLLPGVDLATGIATLFISTRDIRGRLSPIKPLLAAGGKTHDSASRVEAMDSTMYAVPYVAMSRRLQHSRHDTILQLDTESARLAR